MRNKLIFLLMLSGMTAPALAQVSIGIGLPNVSIGINLPVYPQMVPVPGYPVYYAPGMNANYFFYDGMYWVYQADNWYASTWYNGPWSVVSPEFVPLFVLRVPVGYYRQPPAYFVGWQFDASPHWGEHWGNSWAQQHSGWDHWNHKAMPARPPLPDYQRRYSGNSYPRPEQQQALQKQNYRYQAHDPAVRQQLRQQAPGSPRAAHGPEQLMQQNAPIAVHAQSQQHAERMREPAPMRAPARQVAPNVREQRQQPPQQAAARDQHAPEKAQANKNAMPGPQREPGQGREKDREQTDDHGEDRKR